MIATQKEKETVKYLYNNRIPDSVVEDVAERLSEDSLRELITVFNSTDVKKCMKRAFDDTERQFMLFDTDGRVGAIGGRAKHSKELTFVTVKDLTTPDFVIWLRHAKEVLAYLREDLNFVMAFVDPRNTFDMEWLGRAGMKKSEGLKRNTNGIIFDGYTYSV